MQIDRRRIVNGLAWAGAALIVAIPAADLIARQFAAERTPQLAIVQEEPAPSASSPAPAASAPVTEPTKTADAAPSRAVDGDVVDSYLQSGRELPSYISDGGAATPSGPSAPAIAPQPVVTPTAPAAPSTPQAQPSRPAITAARPVTGFPTPISERPLVVAAPLVTPNPPLIVDVPASVVTAEDLEDWETGPLSDFLANRGGQGGNSAPRDYDANGFWLDQGPDNGRDRRLPPAYDDEYYYPFGQ